MLDETPPVARLHDGCLDQRESESHTLGQWEAGTEVRRYLPEDRPEYTVVAELMWVRHLHGGASKSPQHWVRYREFRTEFRYSVSVVHRSTGHMTYLRTGIIRPEAESYGARFSQLAKSAWNQVLDYGDEGLMVEVTE